MRYKIWIEGYVATGENGKARLAGEVEADSFEEACEIWAKRGGPERQRFFKGGEQPTHWGCRMFDNERDARKLFG